MFRAFSAIAVFVFAAVSNLEGDTLLASQGRMGIEGTGPSVTIAEPVDPAGLAPSIVWRTGVGSGFSGVSFAKDKAVTMFEDGGQFIVALDAATGEELWRRRVGESFPGRDGSWDGPISTPVLHGELVVALEPWGRLFALDLSDGSPVWSVDLTDAGHPLPGYGFGSSPVVVGDTLVVHGGGPQGTVLGFDIATGESRWTVGSEPVLAPSPVQLTLAGRSLVVASGQESLFGIDSSLGTVLWKYAHGGSGYKGEGSLKPVGLDGGRIFLAHDDQASQVIAVRRKRGKYAVEQVWLDRAIRNSYSVAVHHDGFLFAFSARILVCVNAASGKLQWRSRKPGDGFLSLAGDKLVILTKGGNLHVARATSEGYQELASAAIFDEPSWSIPTLADGSVFVRGSDEVVRVDLNEGPGISKAEPSKYHPRSLDPGDGEFGRFLRAVEIAVDPAPKIDAFFAAHPELPLIEGEELVHFVYRGEEESPAIAGDHIGARLEAPMVRVGKTDLFYYSARLMPNARISYVFTGEAGVFRDPHNPLGSETLLYDADREFSTSGERLAVSELRMPKWVSPRHLREPDLADRGSLETLVVQSVPFGKVTVQVHLPQGYSTSLERYPVIYYHGQTPPDLSAVPRTLDNLIAGGDLPAAIAVFSEARLPPTPDYTIFWADELVPLIDASYRTIAAAHGRVGVGGDLGALHAAYAAFERPEMTSGLGLHSVSWLDSDWEVLEPMIEATEGWSLRIYLDWGAYSMRNPLEDWDLRSDSARFWGKLEGMGFTLTGGEAPDGDGWASWCNRADSMLRTLLVP